MSIAKAKPGRREQTKRQNRDVLMAAALRVFTELGLEGCSARDIVRESGLSPGTFYNYFGDKEAMFAELIDEAIAPVDKHISEMRGLGLPPEQFFGGGFLAYLNLMAQSPEILALFGRNTSAARAALQGSPSYQNIGRNVSDYIREGVSTGILECSEIELMTDAMLTLAVESSFSAWQRDKFDPDVIASFLTDLFTRSLRSRTPQRST